MKDVRYVLHTHLHIDHAGYDDHFPMDGTTVVINRRELEYSVSGLMGEQYPAPYIKHLVDRLHHPGALRLLDLEVVDDEEIIPGVRCEAAGGHTEGSMNILVDTDEGVACICGDVIYDIEHQLVDPHLQVMELDPAVTGNHGGSKRGEKAAIRKALSGARFVLPAHDRPAVVEHGTRRPDVRPRPGTADRQRRFPGQTYTPQNTGALPASGEIVPLGRVWRFRSHRLCVRHGGGLRSPSRRSRSARAASSSVVAQRPPSSSASRSASPAPASVGERHRDGAVQRDHRGRLQPRSSS